MIIAKVLGNVVATQKNHRYEGARVMMCEQMTPEGELTGHTVLALDAVDAGVGELVFWCRGKEASFPFKREDTPTDCTIVAIVDSEAHVCCG